jgi:hypothetical protein
MQFLPLLLMPSFQKVQLTKFLQGARQKDMPRQPIGIAEGSMQSRLSRLVPTCAYASTNQSIPKSPRETDEDLITTLQQTRLPEHYGINTGGTSVRGVLCITVDALAGRHA